LNHLPCYVENIERMSVKNVSGEWDGIETFSEAAMIFSTITSRPVTFATFGQAKVEAVFPFPFAFQIELTTHRNST
ncbi:MAG: hypothetical protein KJ002_13750, partial [Candidatus Dadabacteria bacterium]|nr:hypothetical protein [Candidatus Dadabacteria bacterium]